MCVCIYIRASVCVYYGGGYEVCAVFRVVVVMVVRVCVCVCVWSAHARMYMYVCEGGGCGVCAMFCCICGGV